MIDSKVSVPGKPSKWAVFLSMIFPGAGQLMQKRWISAAVFMGLSLVCLTVFFSAAIKIMINGLMVGIDFNNYQETELPTGLLLRSAGAVIILYIAGLVDTVAGHLRLCSEWTRKRILEGRKENTQAV